ncbi:MAG: ATP-binding cassette domain-containing protein, partial [Magnetococcales bacterium]|nr:ATP-binding cassette domain-containing protein [Magnetococcales bacterium]
MTTASPSPALSIRNVQQSYDKRPVLDGIDLTVQAGESLALVGINGAGKTTLIKGILNFIALDAGDIQICNTPHTNDSSRRALLYLPERFTPAPFFTGLAYILHTAHLYGTSVSREKAEEMCRGLDLEPEALTSSVGSYSKGMTQKLGLAAALLVERHLLL